MNSFYRLLSLSILVGLLLISCASYPEYDNWDYLPDSAPLAVDENDAQVIVTRIDNEGRYIGIFIDGKYAGKLGNGETGFYKLTTSGIHKITARYDYMYEGRFSSTGNYLIVKGVLTKPIEFVDFGSFYTKYIGYEDKGWLAYRGYSANTTEFYVELLPNNDNKIGVSSVGKSSSNLPPINETFKMLSKNIPDDSRIAIINVYSNSIEESVYYIDELTVLFVNAKHFVVDRNYLQSILLEQQFQMSGYVDDNSIISIGKFSGANVVLTGNINIIDGKRRLVFRALDVLTARIIAMSSVDL